MNCGISFVPVQIILRAHDRELFLYVGTRDELLQLRGERIDDLARHSRRPRNAEPRQRVEAGNHRLAQRRHLGNSGGPARGRDRERPDPAGADVRHGGVEVGAAIRMWPAIRSVIACGLPRYAISHDLEAVGRFELLAGDLGAGIAVAVFELAGIALGVGDGLADGADRQVRMDDDERHIAAEPRYRGEIPNRIIGHRLVERLHRRMGGLGRERELPRWAAPAPP